MMGDDESRAREARDDVLGTLKSLRETGIYSDLTVICGDVQFKVHKAVVCSRSSFFAKAIDGGFKAGLSGEVDLTGASIDNLRTDESTLIGYVLDYLYGIVYLPIQNLTEPPERKYHRMESRDTIYYAARPMYQPRADTPDPDLPEHNAVTHAQMYALGEYFGVEGLKAAAQTKFRHAARLFGKTERFAEAVNVVYTTTIDTDRGLRDIVCEVLLKNMELLLRPEYESLMLRHNGLAYGLLRARMTQNGGRL